MDGDDGPPPRRLLIAGNDEAACRVYAGLLATYTYQTETVPLADVVSELRDTLYGCVVLVGTSGEESSALKQLDSIRHSDHTHVRRTAVMLLASGTNRRVFAWEAGVDGFITMPADAAEIAGHIDQILQRPRLERYQHRQDMVKKINTEHSEA